MNMNMKVAVVTGAAGGLGQAIVVRLLTDGWAVAAWDHIPAALDALVAAMDARSGARDNLLPVCADVGDEGSVHAASAATLRWRNRLDALINNAGIPGPNLPIVDLPLSEWDAVLRVNLTGAFLCARAVLPALLKAPAGRLVNIASVAGKLASPGIAAYAASKAGVVSLTKSLARELVATPVRVNCITPGAIRTDIFKRWPDSYVQELVQKIPLGRFGTPQELAAMAAWLVSEEASEVAPLVRTPNWPR